MGYQKWPEELVQDAYFIEGESDMSQLLGTVVRFPVTAGEPVTQGSLVSPGDRGFLAAALGPGMRAVTVPVSAKTGVAGFVFPGDRVDVVLTQTVEGEGRPLQAAETVLRNLRVLATDQTTEQVTDDEGKTVVRAFRTVTLEVTPQIAEKVAVAQTIGQLTLVLRSIADNQAELERAIASGDIKIPETPLLKKKSVSCAPPWAQPGRCAFYLLKPVAMSRASSASNIPSKERWTWPRSNAAFARRVGSTVSTALRSSAARPFA